MKTRNIAAIFVLSLVFGACAGGPKKTTPATGPEPEAGDANKPADAGKPSDAGKPADSGTPTPSGPASGPATTVADKEVSKALNKKFQDALKGFFAASNAGWPKDQCEKVAESFLGLLKENGGEKVATFPYNAGVAYSRCGMLDKARDAFRKALSLDPAFPSAKAALALLDLRSPEDFLRHEADLMKDSYAMQDPDIQYNLALAYFTRYAREGGEKNSKPMLDALRKALASSGKIPNDTLEGTRIRMKIYGLSILFYLEADKRKDANVSLARIFIQQARDYFRPCAGEQAVKDVYAREALAMYYNASGLYMLQQGNLGPAFDEFKKAKECENDNLAANLNIGMLGVSVREPEMAVRALELVVSKYPKAPEIKEAELALAVAYKVYAMTLQDMAEHQFENKERIQMEIDRLKEAMKMLQQQLDVAEQVIKGDNVRAMIPKIAEVTNGDAKAMQAALDKGEVTVKMIKDEFAKIKPRLEEAIKETLPKRLKDREEELAKLADVEKLKSEAKQYFEKARGQYEKTLAANPGDYRVAFNLAMLYYKAGDILGDIKVNYGKAKDLFDKVQNFKKVPKDYVEFAKKYSSDIKSALVRLNEVEQEKKNPASAPAPAPAAPAPAPAAPAPAGGNNPK